MVNLKHMIGKIIEKKDTNIIRIYCNEEIVIGPDDESSLIPHDEYVEISKTREGITLTHLIPYERIDHVEIIDEEEFEKFKEKAKNALHDVFSEIFKEE